MRAKKRGPARFEVTQRSAAFQKQVTWKITVTTSGVSARRTEDGREISIDWRKLLGAAMFYGCDSLRGEEGKL